MSLSSSFSSCRLASLRRRSILSAATLTVVSAFGAAGCAGPEPTPFDPVAVGNLQLESADQSKYGTLSELPDGTYDPSAYDPQQVTRNLSEQAVEVGTTTRPATRPAGEEDAATDVEVVPISLREAIARATLNNNDVLAASFNPAIEETRVIEALARFDPTFFVETQYRYAERQTAGSTFNVGLNDVVTIDREDTEEITASTGIRQLLPSGGSAEIAFNTTRTDLQPRRFNINPAWENEILLQINQPLLRDFGFDVNQARILINRNQQRISLLEFRGELEETLADVEQTYWDLARARAEVRIQEELLQQTVETAFRILGRVTRDARREQLSQANSRVATRRAELLRARAEMEDLSDQLKRLINDPALPVSSATVLVTETEPLLIPLNFDFDASVAQAFLNRPELGQQQLQIESATTALRVADSNLLPRLDLVLIGGFQGVGEDFAEATEEQFGFDNLTGAVGLQFEVPLGNRAARAILRRARLQRLQAITQYKSLINQVALDVARALRQVEVAYKTIIELRQARIAAQDTVRSLLILEEQGQPLTPEFSDRKLREIENLANARIAEAEAIRGYQLAILNFERAKGTLLRYNNVELEEATADALR